jgi:hypothetical protein
VGSARNDRLAHGCADAQEGVQANGGAAATSAHAELCTAMLLFPSFLPALFAREGNTAKPTAVMQRCLAHRCGSRAAEQRSVQHAPQPALRMAAHNR